MTANERMAAELEWMRRRSEAAAPARHPSRAPACPPLGALARERLGGRQRGHAASCPHCGAVLAAAAARTPTRAAAAGAVAAALVAGLLLGRGQPAPERFSMPSAATVQPPPRALAAAESAPPVMHASVARLPAHALGGLPVVRPLERFQPPRYRPNLVPLVVLAGPPPPTLEPAPPPDLAGMFSLREL